MLRLVARSLGVVGVVGVAACFKLNPGFVEDQGTGGSLGTSDSLDTGDSQGDSQGNAPQRVEDGLVLLYVFDQEACQDSVIEPRFGTYSLELGGSCTSCGPEGLQIEAGCAPAVQSEFEVDLGTGESFTIEAWVSDASGEIMLALGVGDDRSFALNTSGDGSREVLYSGGPTASQWIMGMLSDGGALPWHLAVTHDGRVSRLFIDGVFVTEREDLELSAWMPGPLKIAGDNREWSGKIHLLAIYDRALSRAQYETNYAAGPPGGS